MSDPSVRLEVSRIKGSDGIPAVSMAAFFRLYTQTAISLYPRANRVSININLPFCS